ncbi:MAG: caspase family protein, partial [Candidatus Hodarchaeota archaeon]
KAVTSMDFSDDGDHLVSGSSDGRVSILSMNWMKTGRHEFRYSLKLPVQNKPIVRVQFGPNHTNALVIAGEKAHILSLDGKSEPLVFEVAELLRNAWFSPDGKWLVTLTENSNSAALWSTSGEGQRRELGEVQSITFDSDGSRLALIRPDDYAEILSMTKESEPFVIGPEQERSRSLFLWEEEDEDDILAILAVGFSQDLIIALVEAYKGPLQIRFYLGKSWIRNNPELPPWPKPLKLRLLADLQVDPNESDYDYYWKVLYPVLIKMKGTQGVLHKRELSENHGYRDKILPIETDHKIPVFGNGRYVTQAEVKKALTAIFEDAKRMENEEGEVLLFIYIASHGELGTNGKPYIQVANSSANDESSWISYEAFLEPIQRFVTEVGQSPMNRRALVIIDACQASRDKRKSLDISTQIPTPPGLIVVHSTSPGQYAFHWQDEFSVRESGSKLEHEKKGLFKRKKSTEFKLTNLYKYNMSVMPRANQWLLEDMELAAKPTRIRIFDWLESIKERAAILINQINKRDATHYQQDMLIYNSDSESNIDLFFYLPNPADRTFDQEQTGIQEGSKPD